MVEGSSHAERIRRLLLAVPNRRRVFEAISRVPGTHLRRLSRELALAIGSVEHHLRQLERHGLVFSHRGGRRRTYYVAGALGPEDAAVLHALHKPSWGVILELLLRRPEWDASHVARKAGVSPDSASYTLRRMKSVGLVDHVRVGKQSVYSLRDPDRVRRLHGLTRALASQPQQHPVFGSLIERAGIQRNAAPHPSGPDSPPRPANLAPPLPH